MSLGLRRALFDRGQHTLQRFCRQNALPDVRVLEGAEARRHAIGLHFACAFYRPALPPEFPDPCIVIDVARCATIGHAGRAWSFPGYVVDRTPFGVLAHELGHHVDWVLTCRTGRPRHPWQGNVSRALRPRVAEPPLTGYAPNDAEWFAELFRLFVTNPALLALLRPATFAALQESGLRPIEPRPWTDVLHEAPARTLTAARRKIIAAQQARRPHTPLRHVVEPHTHSQS